MAKNPPSSMGINVEEMLKSMGLDPVEVVDGEEGASSDPDAKSSMHASARAQESLDDLLGRVREEAASGMDSSKQPNKPPSLPACNGLFNDRSEEMAVLIEDLTRFVSLSGSASGYGFLNVLSALSRKVKAGELDCLSNRDYNLIVRDANELGKIWEGRAVVQGFPLVRNAMFYTMLHDPSLFDAVYDRTREWLHSCAQHLEEVGVSLK